MKDNTRMGYAKRIERVVCYLADHLDQPLDLNRLADEACLSPYHFHRIYVAFTGETLALTVRRLRMHYAAANLLVRDVGISILAKETGYGSLQAFNRVFKESYGLTPSQYRARGGLTKILMSSEMHDSEMFAGYEVTIQPRESARAVALRHQGSYMEIIHTYERLAAWAAGQNLFNKNTRVFVVYYDDPALVACDDLRADICISVPDEFVLKDGASLNMIQLPAGRCAVLKHCGAHPELINAYQYLFGDWLGRHNEEPDDQPHFEEHLTNPKSVPPSQLETLVYLPLKPRPG